MKRIMKKIIYRGCLKDLCYLIGGLLFLSLPVITKFLADLTIYKLGV